MKKKPEVISAPMTASLNCGCLRCAIALALSNHPDREDGNGMIGALISLAAELMSTLPESDETVTEMARELFRRNLTIARSGGFEGESVH